MGALKLAYYETKSPLKIANRREEKEGEKVAQGFLSVDPVIKPWESPYGCFGNNPILYKDLKGNDWFYYVAQGATTAEYHWHDGTTLQLQTGVDVNNNAVFTTLEGHAAVVIYDGSRNEQLGTGGNIDAANSVTATMTVYGPGGANDVATYTGYTMTSDAVARTPIDEGEYTVKRRASSGTGSLPKHYQVFEDGVDNIRTMDGAINTNVPSQVRANGDGYKTEIFIHRTNNDGRACGTVSTGCLLISPTDWNAFNNQLSPLGNALDNAPNSREFTLIVNRDGSDHNPILITPVEQTCGDVNRDYVSEENVSGNAPLILN